MEQYERARRYLNKIENVYAGVFSSTEHILKDYDDDVYSFFIHCYHIRDWIIQLNKVGVTSNQVDAFINSQKSLSVCADLANGTKHCKLTRTSRTKHQPRIVSTERQTSTWLINSGGGEVLKCKYTILCNSEFFDALKLAKECIHAWDGYMHDLEILHNMAVNIKLD